MGIELNSGDLFITITEEVELSAKEHLSHIYHLNAMSSMSLTTDSLALLNSVCNMLPSNGKFTIECQVPIMIQARWHKNSRIRKKWLKRFGMKPDTVKIRMDATAGEYHTDDGSFDFEADKQEYVWRPDQQRRGIKVEW